MLKIKSFTAAAQSILWVLGILVLAMPADAATISTNSGDVYIGFRKSSFGSDGGGTNLLVDAGPISYFTNLAPNTKVTITAYTAGLQLSQVGTNSIGWSAFAYFAGAPAANTIFITAPRSSLNVPTAPNNCPQGSASSYTIGQMQAILNGAVDNSNSAAAAFDTASTVLVPDGYNYGSAGSDVSYCLGVGANLDFNGTFTYNFEQYTPANFTTAGVPVRSDFYWMPAVARHVTQAATFLGYFEFGTNGVMTYTAYPSAAVVAPVITAFSRTNTVSYVTFTTGSSGTYTLRGTNSAGLAAARTNWPAIASVGGNGSPNTLADTTSSSNKFYVITAQ